MAGCDHRAAPPSFRARAPATGRKKKTCDEEALSANKGKSPPVEVEQDPRHAWKIPASSKGTNLAPH
jgi:hypothetical protein